MRMGTWRTMLLASAAALALTAGSGFAQGMQNQSGAGTAAGAAEQHGGGAQPHAAQSPGGANKSMGNEAMGHAGTVDHSGQGTNERAGASTMQKGAQRNAPGANRSAEENRGGNLQNKTNMGNERNAQTKSDERNAQKQNGATTNNRAAEQNREKNRGTAQELQKTNERNAATQQRGNNKAAEQLERNNRLQGNASGVSVQLNDKQRNEIRTTVIDKGGAPRVGHVDFDVAVGTVVPRAHVHIVPVPETLVRIQPEWRGYMYFVYEDEIVIVNPRDMRIIAVVAV